MSRWFDIAVASLVIANVVFMALRQARESDTIFSVQRVSNGVFIAIYGCEIAVKVTGLGLKQFLDSGWNCFDIFVLVGSVISAAFGVDTVGLFLRSLRIFRLVSFCDLVVGVGQM